MQNDGRIQKTIVCSACSACCIIKRNINDFQSVRPSVIEDRMAANRTFLLSEIKKMAFADAADDSAADCPKSTFDSGGKI
jgi:hypothetical protein